MQGNKLHTDILTPEQNKFAPALRSFAQTFGLVGGTAIALHLGHRRSVDFDLFSVRPFRQSSIRTHLLKYGRIEHVFVDSRDEYTVLVGGVKLTFFHYPFFFKFAAQKLHGVPLADIPTLAALKAYALGRRAKWKDYVDLYFIMREKGGIDSVIKKARLIFGKEFNEKLFRSQLSYFNDVDRTEKVIYIKGRAVPDTEIKKALIAWSVE